MDSRMIGDIEDDCVEGMCNVDSAWWLEDGSAGRFPSREDLDTYG